MQVEVQAYRRFVSVYLLSTLILLLIGGYFYYRTAYQTLLEERNRQMQETIERFIEINQKNHFLRTGTEPEYGHTPIAVYVDKVFQTGNFKPKKIDLDQEYFTDGTKLYHVSKEHKRWGDVYFVTYTEIASARGQLQKQILLLLLGGSVFAAFIALVLGKMFLAPMRRTIISLENFIADATHEVNTPLSNILINIELAKELYPSLQENEECRKIESSAHRLHHIFSDLRYVQLNHRRDAKRESLRIDGLLRERIAFFETQLRSRGLVCYVDTEPVVLAACREDMLRLIDNLLSNAVKYSPPNETIFVELTQHKFKVRNRGDIRNIKKVLQKFERENQSEGGFGLGLYIVQKICKIYGFSFLLNSQNKEVCAVVQWKR